MHSDDNIPENNFGEQACDDCDDSTALQLIEPSESSAAPQPSSSELQAASGDSASTHHLAPSVSALTFGVTSDVSDASHINDYLHQYVTVSYDGLPYPGKVSDTDEQQGDLYVSCMHHIGPNRFFWPTHTDVCWYNLDEIVA